MGQAGGYEGDVIPPRNSEHLVAPLRDNGHPTWSRICLDGLNWVSFSTTTSSCHRRRHQFKRLQLSGRHILIVQRWGKNVRATLFRSYLATSCCNCYICLLIRTTFCKLVGNFFFVSCILRNLTLKTIKTLQLTLPNYRTSTNYKMYAKWTQKSQSKIEVSISSDY